HPQLASTISTMSNHRLTELLRNSNGWQRDTAQRLLVERRAVEVIPDLLKLATDKSRTHLALHALWTIEGLVADDRETDPGRPRLHYRPVDGSGVWPGLLEVIPQNWPVAGYHALQIVSQMAEGSADLETEV